MRGRKPQPTALKKARGNPGRRRLPAEPNIPTLDDLTCPKVLTGAAAMEWQRIAPVLRDAGILTESDVAALVMYCACYGRWIEASAHLAREGDVIKGTRGHAVKSPWHTIAKTAFEQSLKLIQEFGLSPVSRARVQIARKSHERSLAELLFESATGQGVSVGDEAEEEAVTD